MIRFALFALLASPAQAYCPTAGDLPGGVVLVQNAPFFLRSDFERSSIGVTETRIDRASGANRQRTFLLGHGLAPTGIFEGATITEITYDGDLTALDRLQGIGDIVLSGRLSTNAGPVEPVQLALSYMGAAEREILNCGYDIWTVSQILLVGGQILERRELDYAPALGVVVAARDLDEDGAQVAEYAYSWIGTGADVAR